MGMRTRLVLIALVVFALAVALVVAYAPTSQPDCLGGGSGQLARLCAHRQPDWVGGALAGVAAYFVGVAFVLSVRALSKIR